MYIVFDVKEEFDKLLYINFKNNEMKMFLIDQLNII